MNRPLQLLLIVTMTIGCAPKPSVISLGMNKSSVDATLYQYGARDIGYSFATTNTVSGKANPKGWMWRLGTPDISVETIYSEGKLSKLNVWDWTKRKQRMHHHSSQFEEVTELRLGPDGLKMTIIKTHNAETKNPEKAG